MKAYVVFSNHPTVAVIMSSQLNSTISPGYFTAASKSVIINFLGFFATYIFGKFCLLLLKKGSFRIRIFF